MANKRELKKYLKCVSGEVIEEALFISEYYDNVDGEKINAVIGKVLNLVVEKVSDVSVSFDKTCKISFNGDRKAYNKAHATYYKACYHRLLSDFQEGINEAIKDIKSLRD